MTRCVSKRGSQRAAFRFSFPCGTFAFVRPTNVIAKPRPARFRKFDKPPIGEKMNSEQGDGMENKKIIENAVVGIVDMVSSTKLSNSVDVFTDWEIKERFLKAAQARANQTGMMILSYTGDGFLFLANPKGGIDWPRGLAKFQTLIVSDFRTILAEYSHLIGDVSSGIRFGVATGPIIVGYLGARDNQCMAVGAAINLAARLCAAAEIDQMAISANAWEVFGTIFRNLDFAMCAHDRLKGFDHVILGFHVYAADAYESKRDSSRNESKRWPAVALAHAA